MNGFLTPLPGLLDDPQFQALDLPSISDFHVAPLRNPAPSRYGNAPLPLEPVTDNAAKGRGGTSSAPVPDISTQKKPATTRPFADWIAGQNANRANLPISKLVEIPRVTEPHPTPLQPFISLAVLENSSLPSEPRSNLRSQKRPRLDGDVKSLSTEEYRHLPQPTQKGDKTSMRTVPLLPAMVTGLHEPPPSASLLPSMDVDDQAKSTRTGPRKLGFSNLVEKRESKSHGRPPELMINSPEVLPISPIQDTGSQGSQPQRAPNIQAVIHPLSEPARRQRRPPRKWTDEETAQLLAGVRKYGIGKWKQILLDPSFVFQSRSTVDLKDRFRVCMPDEYKERKEPMLDDTLRSLNSGLPHPRTSQNTRTYPSASVQMNANAGQSRVKIRRERRAWTTVEDDSLLKGVAKYGFQWTLIHGDEELHLSHRRATDLRDRIRTRFPDNYKHAETAPPRAERQRAAAAAAASAVSEAISIKPSDEGSNLASPPKTTKGHSSRVLGHSGQSGNHDLPFARHSLAQHNDQPQEQVGLTLPPLVLDDSDLDWGNPTLPPLLDWDDIGL